MSSYWKNLQHFQPPAPGHYLCTGPYQTDLGTVQNCCWMAWWDGDRFRDAEIDKGLWQVTHWHQPKDLEEERWYGMDG